MQNILKGHISQIVGPVVDVHFELGKDGEGLPEICDALEIERADGRKLIVEVQQHNASGAGWRRKHSTPRFRCPSERRSAAA